MSQIMSDGTQLLYECILCHRYKPISFMKCHGDIYVCRSCPEVPEPEITVIPISISKSVILPTPEEFGLFFDDTIFFKTEPIPSLINTILTLTNPKTGKSIQLNTTAILQVLVDKFNYPIFHNLHEHNIDMKLYIQEAYEDIQEKISNSILKFNRILAFEDKRIKDLCESYHQILSSSFLLKLQYQSWEKLLIKQYVDKEIAKGLHEKDKQVSQIQQEYSKKLTDEKVANNTKLENYSREILRLQGMVDSLNSITSSKKEELSTIKLEKDEMYSKYKSLELQLQEKGVEISKLNLDNGKLKRELEKHKIVEEWMLDPTSTEKMPIYFNQVTGEHITYPENFKENYKPDSVDGEILIYKEKDGNKNFNLPKSLLRYVKSLTTTENGTSSVVNEKLGLSGNDTKVLNIMSRNKEDAKTKKELSELTEISASHIGNHLKKLMKLNLIIKFDDENKDERFYRI